MGEARRRCPLSKCANCRRMISRACIRVSAIPNCSQVVHYISWWGNCGPRFLASFILLQGHRDDGDTRRGCGPVRLEFGGAEGMVVTTVKEWAVTIKLDQSVTSMDWGKSKQIVVTSEKERAVRFYEM